MIHIAVQRDAIDIAAEQCAAAVADAGGVASFVVYVRADDGVALLELEHYPRATEAALQMVASEAAERWGLRGVRIVHRVGPMVPGDAIVFVAAAASHRGSALEACAFLIDRLKTDAPFWKKETRADGTRWVEPRGSDEAAAARWDA
ncbi:MAG: molybdenum cofactor biosynthesis protein MoaE [Sphingomonas sp.]